MRWGSRRSTRATFCTTAARGCSPPRTWTQRCSSGYAHGLVRIEEVGTVEAVSDLAELIALCAYLRAEEIVGDGPVWAATAAALGRGQLDSGRSSLRLDNDPGRLERLARAKAGDAAVDSALATHRGRLS